MEANAPQRPGGPEQPAGQGRQSRQSGERQGGGRPGGKPPSGASGKPQEPGRTRKHAGRYIGWNDGIDRVWCAARVHEPAAAFPVHSRAAATRPVVVVDRRETEVLLCDGEHWGDHRWPHLPMDECPAE